MPTKIATQEEYEKVLACAKGPKQRLFLEELVLNGMVTSQFEMIKGSFQVYTYGKAELPGSSWRPLKKRIVNETNFEPKSVWENGVRTIWLEFVGS